MATTTGATSAATEGTTSSAQQSPYNKTSRENSNINHAEETASAAPTVIAVLAPAATFTTSRTFNNIQHLTLKQEQQSQPHKKNIKYF